MTADKKPENGQMDWHQVDHWHLRKGNFTVAKVFIGGETFYEAWCGKRCLGVRLASAEAAKGLCE